MNRKIKMSVIALSLLMAISVFGLVWRAVKAAGQDQPRAVREQRLISSPVITAQPARPEKPLMQAQPRGHALARAMATITVTNTNDGAAPGPVGSLRRAINDAMPGDTINFSLPNPSTITLTNGNLYIDKSLIISGPGATALTIDGNSNERVFWLVNAPQVSFSGLTITNGSADFGGGINSQHSGVSIDSCAIVGNRASNGAAGLNIHTGSMATITNSTISGNMSSGQSGGVQVNDSTATFTNCTIAGNTATVATGVTGLEFSAPTSVTLINCTVANHSPHGVFTQDATIRLQNTLVADNMRNFVNNSGTITSLGHNLDTDGRSGFTNGMNGDIAGTTGSPINALLSPLNNHGGPTSTLALLPGSPAINAGTSTDAPSMDQRGVARAGATDIGAFESRGFTLAVASGNNQTAVVNTNFASPLSVTVTSGAGEPVNDGQVTFTPPGSGASAAIAGNPATIASGTATTGTVTANGTGGTYNVEASANGAAPTVNFSLTNNIAPTVLSIVRGNASPTNNGTVPFNVTFSESVTGVAASNFTPVPGGSVTGAMVTNVMGSGTTWTVTVSTGMNSGTLGLNMTNSTGVTDSGGAAVSNLTFTGQVYTVDKTEPTTSITANPTNPSASATAGFSFTGSDTGGAGLASFQCQLDGGGFSACTSPQTYLGLADGSHTFQVRAIDAVGNQDSTPATYTWVIDTVTPDTIISGNPTNPSASANATFTFTGSDPGGSGVASFQCQIDGGGFSACTSPRNYTGLSDGSHVFQVRAIDAAGNVDPTPATFTWTIDTTQPDTTITATPPNPSASANASFSFTGNDGGGTGVVGFECQIDGGAFIACTSPRTYTGLSDGSHTFQVRAVDAAGNADSTPASFTWMIDTAPPPAPTVITPANSSSTNNTQPLVSGVAEANSNVTIFLDGTAAGMITADVVGNWIFTPPSPLSNGSHTARARATDAAGNTSVDSNTNTFTVDTVAPNTTIVATPANPSASANASFSFTGDDGSGSGVIVFECKLDGGAFVTCTSPQIYTGLSEGLHTFQVRAIDAANNTDPTPANYTWLVDTTAPDTTITANPPNPSGSANASFSFTGNDGGGAGVNGFECQLDGGGFSACTNPQAYTGLSEGSHTFQVRAVDIANNKDDTPASYTWVVDTIAPDTTITANPPALNNNSSASFSFTGNDPGGSGVASFECQLDGGGFSACTSPRNYTGLGDGSHTFQVRAIDVAGNMDQSPAGYTWTVDVTPPDTTITANPPNPSGSSSVSFSFTGSDNLTSPGSLTFECKLDGGSFTACASPQNYAGLSLGTHTFQVRAIDATGNTDSTPASYVWSFNAPPIISLTNLSRPAGSATITTTIASAGDEEDPEDQLFVQISTDGTNFFGGITTGNVTVTLMDQNDAATGVNPTAAGNIIAIITTPCDSTAGPLNLFLRVTDSAALTETKPWALTITPNPPPVLSYGSQTVAAGTTPMINPATGPMDNGTINPLALQSIVPATGLTLSLNPSSGQIAVTGATLIGNYAVTITATDNCGAAANITFTVIVVCPAITLSPASLPNATVNTAYAQTVAASPAGGNYTFAVASGSLPAGLTLNSNGSFSGAPAVNGTFNFRVTATGFGGCTAFLDYVLIVNCASVTLNPASLPGGTVGTVYSQTVLASPAGIYSYTVTSGALPPGLSLNAATGAITGTPATTGSFNFTIRAATGSCFDSRSYAIVIGCSSLLFTTTSPLPAAQAGVAYSQTLNVTPAAPAGSYTFSLTAGNLPSGLTLNPATGVISGTPGTTGSTTFSIKVEGAGGCFATQSYTLVIGCPPITVNPASLPGGTVGSGYSQTITASPAGGNYTFAVASGSLPAGLNLNPVTGILSGTPTTNGSFTFTVTATGFGGCTGNRSYTVVIGGGAGCPTITLPANLPNGTTGQLYNSSVAASPSGSYSYGVTAGGLPAGVTLYGSFGLLFGYPLTPGSYSFTITATGSNNCTSSQAYTVVIGGASLQLPSVNDFGGDRRSDFVLWRAGQAQWLIVDSATETAQTVQWGQAGDVPAPGDYDGDGKADLANFGKDGRWRIKLSGDGSTLDISWGLGTDLPIPGDYDGDGKTDLAVWRGTETAWYIRRSSDGQTRTEHWGASYAPYFDVPAPGDYDGDGLTDIAIYRRGGEHEGYWFIKRSSDGAVVSKHWGLGTDVAMPGDYDGDGKADIGIWRGSEGGWYFVNSSDGMVGRNWLGVSGAPHFDAPALGDYDGDSQADISVWRGSEGRWYIIQSSDGETRVVTLGRAGDAPVACFSPSHYHPPARAEIAANSTVVTTSNARRRSFQQRW